MTPNDIKLLPESSWMLLKMLVLLSEGVETQKEAQKHAKCKFCVAGPL